MSRRHALPLAREGPAKFAGSAILDEICACMHQAWPDGHPALGSLTGLCERLDDARLQVAVLGQFKRGKSTFINALLGAEFLPAAVVPATAIPTFIGWASTPRISVSYQDPRPAEDIRPQDPANIRQCLRQFVTEEGNPLNFRRIARVDLCVPADILHDGIVLIDTPGIGSTLHHNTDAALRVLPECDAALFVVSADPPITEAELAYLSKVQQHVVRLYFVLNKVDYLSEPEQVDALAFLQTTLHDTGQVHSGQQIFLLSARQALNARAGQDEATLETSGLKRIEHDVLQVLAREKVIALQASICAKATNLVGQALLDLGLQRRALELPLEDLEQRSQALEKALRETERERQVARDLLDGDRRRAVEELESQAEQLRHDGRDHFSGVVRGVIESNGAVLDRASVQQALNAAIPAFFAARLTEVASDFRQLVEAMLARHQVRADALVGSVRQTAAALFDVPLQAVETTEPFRLGPEPYWVTQQWRDAVMPSPDTLVTWLLPSALRQKALRRQLEAEIGALVQHNVENLRWATLRGVNETFRRFSAQLDARLAEVLRVTQGVITRAVERRQSQSGLTVAELQHVHAFAETLAGLRAALAEPMET